MNLHNTTRACALVACLYVTHQAAYAQQPSLLNAADAARIQTAVTGHPAVQSAHARLRAAELRLKAASMPRAFSTLFTEMEEVAPSDLRGLNFKIGFEHPITSSTQRSAGMSVAEAEIAIARAEVAGVTMHLENRASELMLHAALEQQIQNRLASEDSLLQRAASTLNVRFSVGEAKYIDVIRLRTERLRVQADIVESQARASRATVELTSLIGSAVPATLGKIGTLLTEAPIMIDSLLVTSPAARAAAGQELLARARFRGALAQRAKTWNASIALQRFRAESGGSTFGPALAASIAIPLLNRRSIDFDVAAAAQDTVATMQSSGATLRSLRSALTVEVSQIAAARGRIASIDRQLLAAANEERVAALTAYTSGSLTLAELIDFERSLSKAEIQLLQSYDAVITAWHRIQALLAGTSPALRDN